jgi:hypothetical protein
MSEITYLSHTHNSPPNPTPTPPPQARLLLLPWTLALTALASAVGLAARSLTALGFTPPGCAPAGELVAASAALEAAHRREEGHRARLAALAAEVEATARDRRRAAAKLARARAELDLVKGEAGKGAAVDGGCTVSGIAGGGASGSPVRPWPPSPGGGDGGGEWGGVAGPAHDEPDAHLAYPITTRALALATTALALSAAWWATAGPPYPALSHKAVLAAGGPWALTFLLARAHPRRARVWLFGGAWAMVGFVTAHWLVMPDGGIWGE